MPPIVHITLGVVQNDFLDFTLFKRIRVLGDSPMTMTLAQWNSKSFHKVIFRDCSIPIDGNRPLIARVEQPL